MILESDLPECETCEGLGSRPHSFSCGRCSACGIFIWNRDEVPMCKGAPCPSCGGTGHMDPDEYAEQCDEAKAERWRDHCDMIGVDA